MAAGFPLHRPRARDGSMSRKLAANPLQEALEKHVNIFVTADNDSQRWLDSKLRGVQLKINW